MRQKKDDSLELREKCQEAESIFRRLEDELRPLKNELEKLFRDAIATTNGCNPQSKGFRVFNNAFEKLPDTIEKIDEELKIAQAKVFCMAKNDDSENVRKI